MKNVIILGAGMVTGPMVDYLLEQGNISITLADVIPAKAEEIIAGRLNAVAAKMDVTDKTHLAGLIAEADLVVSLVPYTYHPLVAELCIAAKKNMVTASYVSDKMRGLDSQAKEAGIIIMNEIGLDPGIDHMSAMKIIHNIQDRGGNVTSFHSYCGGLPAPESNTNPLGYKFSWSPRGVVLAGKNSAKYQKDGRTVDVISSDLFTHTWNLNFDDIGELTAYPNRDSLPYIDIYGLKGIATLYRGTLRYPGWCETWKLISDMGLLNLEERSDLDDKSFQDLLAEVTGCMNAENLKLAIADKYGYPADCTAISNLDWLGLFSDETVPSGQKTVLDVLSERLLEKMQYEDNERDMIVLHHVFKAEYPDGNTEKITSTLIAMGEPGGVSAMAKTVSLPAAIAVKLILLGKINMTGVHIPVQKETYGPILIELEELGIRFDEKTV